MSIDATTGTATPYASMMSGTGVATDKTSMGNKEFLNLLVTQLKYQDPSAPMDSAAILQQTAAMSTVEQMVEQTTTAREAFGLQLRTSAATFVGQSVSWVDAKGVTQTGVVDSASFKGSTPVLNVGKETVPLDAVSLIQTSAAAAASKAAASAAAATAAAAATEAATTSTPADPATSTSSDTTT